MGGNTFFPKDWTAQQVLKAIEEVYLKPEKIDKVKNFYEGTTSSKIRIRINLDKNKKIISAFPIL